MSTLTVPIPHVRVLWRPEQFTHCWNGDFETNVSGWVTTAGINGAGNTIVRSTLDHHSGSACARVDTGSAALSGVNFDLGTTRFYQEATYGTTYAALVWLKWLGGSRQVRITLGSLGTAADRGTLLITDLPSVWTPYRVLWMPSGTRTDVELAVTNGSALANAFLIDDVAIYQVDAFSQVENSNFRLDTTGWAVTAGINAAGNAITRGTGTSFITSDITQTFAAINCTATSGSGANYDFGLRKFTSGRTYRARVAMISQSGTTSARLRLGSLGTGADRGDASVTITGSWAWYLVDWTPSADRTDVELAVTTGTAAVGVIRISCVEVYEAIDEINGTGTGVRADVNHMDWSRGIDGTGTLNLVVSDPRDARRYTPWYTSGALYGLLEPGRRVWARAVYNDSTIYPVSFGTIRRIIPDAQAGNAQIMCEDPMYDLGRASYSFGFVQDDSYATARAIPFGASAARLGLDPVAGDRRLSLSTTNIEQGTFYNGTNGEVNALDYLEQLNEATGTAHYIAPSALAEVLWRYTTDARPDLAAASTSDETIDDDFFALTGTDKTDEALENTQAVTWQAYQLLPPPDEDGTGYGYVVMASDPDLFGGAPDGMYLQYLDDAFGTDDSIPDPVIEREWHWKRRRRHKGQKKVRVRTYNYRRIYTDVFVPFTMAAGEVRTWVIDFSIPMSGCSLVIDGAVDPEPLSVVVTSSTPRQMTITMTALSALTCSFFGIAATPWLPLDEQTETRIGYDQVLDKGTRDGPALNTPYVPSKGAAQGLGDYRNWRYATARLRPTLTVQHRFPSILQRNPTEHLTINAALFSFTGKVFVITKVSGSSDQGARMWSMDYDLEELPASIGTPFTLGTSALDGSDLLAY